jgi:hypothetical protein
MRVSCDVSVDTNLTGQHLTVVGDAPGVVDEELTLGLVGRDGQLDLRVRVLESRPEIADGVVRHRIRLLMIGAA